MRQGVGSGSGLGGGEEVAADVGPVRGVGEVRDWFGGLGEEFCWVGGSKSSYGIMFTIGGCQYVKWSFEKFSWRWRPNLLKGIKACGPFPSQVQPNKPQQPNRKGATPRTRNHHKTHAHPKAQEPPHCAR